VIQRISAGFAILAALLVAVGLAGLIGQNRVNNALANVADATTVRVGSQALTVSLLEVGRLADSFHATRDAAALQDLRTRFDETKTRIEATQHEFSRISEGDDTLKRATEAFRTSLAAVLDASRQLFDAHGRHVELLKPIDSGRGALEDSADELDAELADRLDHGGNRETLGKLQKKVKQGVIAATDAMQRPVLASARIAQKDVVLIAKDVQAGADQLSAKDKPLGDKLQAYAALLAGDKAPLSLFVQGMELEEQSAQALAELNKRIDEARHALEKVNAAAIAQMDTARAAGESTSRAATASIVVMGVIALAIAGAIAYFVTQSIRVPLARVVAQLKLVAQGDMTQRVSVRSQDEFGDLARWVNELTEKLRAMLEGIATDAVRLAGASEQTAAVTQQTHTGIAQQKQQTDGMVTAMHEMAGSVAEVADSANRALREIKAARDVAEQGQQVIGTSLDTINALAGNIQTASDVVARLNEYSARIGRVVDVIQGVAEQTNLLALNAAIEAARAGEAGRGFAVVADEVRTLASRTRESTSEIQQMVESLQAGMRDAVDVMGASRKETDSSVVQAAAAGQALDEILRSMRQVDAMNASIASAAATQRQVTGGMSRSVSEISEIAEQTAAGAEQTAGSAKELAGLAERLQRMVGQFRI
jgi:methyl-accepting chemotaxis protein